MPNDGSRRLPDHVAAQSLRALMTLPAPRANPLILQRSEYERAPGWDAWSDFNVLWRGQRVGRIFLYEGARRLPDLHPPRKEYIHAIARQA